MISITELAPSTQFDPSMTFTIISDLQSDRERDQMYWTRLLNERDETIEELKGELEGERSQKSKLLALVTRLEDIIYEYELQRSYEKKINANTTLDSSTKIIATEVIREIATKNDDPHTPMVVVQEDIAEKCGVSASTVGRVVKKVAKAGGWDAQRSKPIDLGNGKYKTETAFALKNIIDRPDLVLFEKHSGGARLRVDKGTGEALDTMSMDYSRSQEQVVLRMLPGQRGDLNPMNFITAIKEDRYFFDPHTHNRVLNLTQGEQKQDAFSELIASPTEYAPGTSLREAVDQLDEAIAQKHPAFRFESFAGVEMVEHVTVCRAREALNKDGQPAHKLDSIVSWRECGSTDWQWNKKGGFRECAHCWTRQPQ